MIIKQKIDRIEIDDLVLRKKNSKYEETRKRISRFRNMFSISDKEIIESLSDEIEQYRDRIRKQEEYINQLLDKQIQSEAVELEKIDKLINDNIKAIYKATIFEYESGKRDTLYECDSDNNTECNKKYCRADCCTHTLNKKYAKNFINK